MSTIPQTEPTICSNARERRRVIRHVIRMELPGLLNAEAVRRLAAAIEREIHS